MTGTIELRHQEKPWFKPVEDLNPDPEKSLLQASIGSRRQIAVMVNEK